VLKNKQKVDVDWQQQLANAVREGAVISGAILAVLLILSLASYFPADPGWREAGQFVTVQNLGGHFGAAVADILFSLLGYMAYMLAALPIVQLIKRITGPVIRHSWLGLSWRFLGLSMLLTSGAALTSLYDTGSELPLGVGGAIGEGVSIWLSNTFGLVGGSLLLAGVFLFGLTVFGDISWLASLDHLGALILSVSKTLRSKIVKSRSGKSSRESKAVNEPLSTGGLPAAPSGSFLPDTKTSYSKVTAAKNAARTEPSISALETNDIPTLHSENDSALTASEETAKGVKRLASIFAKPAGQTESATNSVNDVPPWGDDSDGKPTTKTASTKPSKGATDPAEQAASDSKKLLIQPFEKKSKGQAASQGSLFSSTELPPLSLLRHQDGPQETGYSPEQLEHMSRLLEQKLNDFGVKIEVVAVSPGPVITRFEIQPAPGVKASKISNLAKDLARSLAMVSVRLVEVIPGKSVMGIEVPNENRAMVLLGDVLASNEYQSSKSPLSLALGHDIAGDPVTADLAKMPHLLVAGTTGSGKSVGVNSMLISMLYKSTPDDVRLIMVDPKMLELSVTMAFPIFLHRS